MQKRRLSAGTRAPTGAKWPDIREIRGREMGLIAAARLRSELLQHRGSDVAAREITNEISARGAGKIY